MSFQCFDFFKNFGKAVERLSATRREMWRGGGIGAGMEAMREEELTAADTGRESNDEQWRDLRFIGCNVSVPSVRPVIDH
jgi:hypothetical protein